MKLLVAHLQENPANLFSRIQMAKTSYTMRVISTEDFIYLLNCYYKRAQS